MTWGCAGDMQEAERAHATGGADARCDDEENQARKRDENCVGDQDEIERPLICRSSDAPLRNERIGVR